MANAHLWTWIFEGLQVWKWRWSWYWCPLLSERFVYTIHKFFWQKVWVPWIPLKFLKHARLPTTCWTCSQSLNSTGKLKFILSDAKLSVSTFSSFSKVLQLLFLSWCVKYISSIADSLTVKTLRFTYLTKLDRLFINLKRDSKRCSCNKYIIVTKMLK